VFFFGHEYLIIIEIETNNGKVFELYNFLNQCFSFFYFAKSKERVHLARNKKFIHSLRIHMFFEL